MCTVMCIYDIIYILQETGGGVWEREVTKGKTRCVPPTFEIMVAPLGVTTMFVFGGSSIRLQPTPLDGYVRKIRQMTSFRVRKCLLGVPMTIF